MTVIVKYVVERNGVEKMTFTAKQEADAYDKMLDIAEDVTLLLQQSGLVSDEQIQESLAFYLAQHKDVLIQTLQGKAVKPTKNTKPKNTTASAQVATPEHAIQPVELDNVAIESGKDAQQAQVLQHKAA